MALPIPTRLLATTFGCIGIGSTAVLMASAAGAVRSDLAIAVGAIAVGAAAGLWVLVHNLAAEREKHPAPEPSLNDRRAEDATGNNKAGATSQTDTLAGLEQRLADTAAFLREEAIARRKAERQLNAIQKMEAVSHLAAGIAHDLNNKLLVVGANVDAVVKHLRDEPRLRRKLLAALVASDQAAALMSKLLTFARAREQRPQYTDIGRHLTSIAELLGRSFVSNSIEVELHVTEELWPVYVAPDELETALVNLALNARDAMASGGAITISARNARLAEGGVPTLHAGEFVEVSVQDSGAGIAQENLKRVFEPFFTTKAGAHASGLGLSQVQTFVDRLGGGAQIDSVIGKGTRVSIFLPKAELPARLGAPALADDTVDDDEASPATAEILLVDDEVEVVLAMQTMLDQFGYDTRIAVGADEAMEALETRRPHLVLTDVTMPGRMTGLDLGREIQHRYPEVGVVLITGNPHVLSAQQSEFPIIQKPIVSRDLHLAIQRQLAAGKAATNVVPLAAARRRQIS